MTISTTSQRNDYVGNNSTATYSYSYVIFDQSELYVVKKDTSGVETVLALTTDYTVTGVNVLAGGTIVLVAGNLPTGYTLTVLRKVPVCQPTSIRNEGDFFPEVHEKVFDYLTMIDQQQQNQLDGAVGLPDSIAPACFDTTLPTAIGCSPSTSVVVNSACNGFTMGPTTTQIACAQSYACVSCNCAASAAASASTASSCATVSAACAAASAACAAVSDSCAGVSSSCAALSASCAGVSASCASLSSSCSSKSSSCAAVSATCAGVASGCAAAAATSATNAAASATTAGNCATLSGNCSVVSCGCANVSALCAAVSASCANVAASCVSIIAGCAAVAASCAGVSASCANVSALCAACSSAFATTSGNCATLSGNCSVVSCGCANVSAGCATVASNCAAAAATSATNAAASATTSGNCATLSGNCSVLSCGCANVSALCAGVSATCANVSALCAACSSAFSTTSGNCATLSGNCAVVSCGCANVSALCAALSAACAAFVVGSKFTRCILACDQNWTAPATTTRVDVITMPSKGLHNIELTPILTTGGAITSTCDLLMWGVGTAGVRGDGTANVACTPTLVSGSCKWRSVTIAAGNDSAGGITSDGTPLTWGCNACGVLGNGTINPACVPTAMTCGCKVKMMQINGQTGGFITTTGDLLMWGNGVCGVRGDGTTNTVCVPTLVSCSKKWIYFSIGRACNVLAIDSNCDLFAWGAPDCGQLANCQTTNASCTPQPVCPPTGGAVKWMHAFAGDGIAAAISWGADLFTWGQGVCGALGRCSLTSACVPTLTCCSSIKYKWASVSNSSANNPYILALDVYGCAYGMGSNCSLNLGDGTGTVRCVATPVACACRYREVNAGINSAGGITFDGVVLTWGQGACGGLANGATSNSCVPAATNVSCTWGPIKNNVIRTFDVVAGQTYPVTVFTQFPNFGGEPLSQDNFVDSIVLEYFT